MKTQSIKQAAIELLPFVQIASGASDVDVEEMLQLDAAGFYEAVVGLQDSLKQEGQERVLTCDSEKEPFAIM